MLCTANEEETKVVAQRGKKRNEQARSNQLRGKPLSGKFNRVLFLNQERERFVRGRGCRAVCRLDNRMIPRNRKLTKSHDETHKIV